MIRYNGGEVVIVLVLLLMVPLLSTVSCTLVGGTTILRLWKTQSTDWGTFGIDDKEHTVSPNIILACRIQEKASLGQSLRSHYFHATNGVLEKLSNFIHLKDIPFLNAGLIKRSMLIPSMSDEKQDIIYVDDDADPSWYDETHVKTIQDGIAHASHGYTVFVHSGMYFEHVVIDKTISLIGEDKHSTIIDGGGEDDVVFIASGSDGVVVSGFTIQNSGSYTDEYREDAGVDIHASNCDISNNIIINHPLYGIKLTLVNNNVIKENEISHSGYQDYLIGSISLFFSHDNNISQNVITNNNGDGDYGRGIKVRNSSGEYYAINNTIYDADEGMNFSGGIVVKLHGNIIANRAVASGRYEYVVGTVTNADSDYNLLYYPSGSASINWGGSVVGLSTLQSTYSEGLNSDEDNPDFTTPGNDFSLQSDSPAIGNNIEGPSGDSIWAKFLNDVGWTLRKEDINGTTIPSNTWDNGAEEYPVTGATPTP